MRFSIAASMLLILASCGQQSDQGASEEDGLRPQATAPTFPADWAAQFNGQAFATAFPNLNSDCEGHADRAEVEGTVARITGWSWDRSAGRAYDHLVSVGPDGVINGNGRTTRDRADVPRNTDGRVTDAHVGFEIVATARAGKNRVAALDPNTNSACWIDDIDY